MAKFCGNCGTQLDDSALVCGNCGTPLTPKNPNGTVPNLDHIDPENVAKNKKTAKIVIGLVALVVVAVLAFNIISGFVGYKGAVRKIMNAYEDYDIDTIVSMASDYYFCFDNDEYAENYFESRIGYALDELEEDAGHNYNFKYKIVDSYEFSNRKYDSLMESLSYNDDFDPDIISDIMAVEVEITATGRRTKTKNVEIILTKEDGKWRLYDLR